MHGKAIQAGGLDRIHAGHAKGRGDFYRVKTRVLGADERLNGILERRDFAQGDLGGINFAQHLLGERRLGRREFDER